MSEETVPEHDALEQAGEIFAAAIRGDEEAEETDAEEPEEAEGEPEEPDEEPDAEEPDAEEAEPEETEEEKPPRRREVDVRAEEKQKLDAKWAEWRSRTTALRDREEEFHRQRQSHEETLTAARELVEMTRGNPLRAFDLIAEKAGWSKEELFERVQQRVLNDGSPGDLEQHDVSNKILDRLQKLEKMQLDRDERIQQEQQHAAVANEQQSWDTALGDLVITGEAKLPGVVEPQAWDGSRWQFVDAFAKADPVQFRKELGEEVRRAYDYSQRSGQPVPPGVMFDVLDERLANIHARGTALAGHLSEDASHSSQTARKNGRPRKARKTVQRTTPDAGVVSADSDSDPDLDAVGKMLIAGGFGR
ncbi:MAG: hypothetical protein V3V65_06665 [Hyphomicrobium sp.]